MDIEAEIIKLQVQVNALKDQLDQFKSSSGSSDHYHNYSIPANSKEQAQITAKTEGTYGL